MLCYDATNKSSALGKLTDDGQMVRRLKGRHQKTRSHAGAEGERRHRASRGASEGRGGGARRVRGQEKTASWNGIRLQHVWSLSEVVLQARLNAHVAAANAMNESQTWCSVGTCCCATIYIFMEIFFFLALKHCSIFEVARKRDSYWQDKSATRAVSSVWATRRCIFLLCKPLPTMRKNRSDELKAESLRSLSSF